MNILFRCVRITFFMFIAALATIQLGCAEKGSRVIDIVSHFQTEGFQIDPLDGKRRLAYERESKNLLHITNVHHSFGGNAISAVRGIQEQDAYTIKSIPVTFIKLKNESDAMIVQDLLKELELSHERAVSVLSPLSPDVELLTIHTTSSLNGRFLIMIQCAKIDENGRIRARLRKNNVMIKLIKDTFGQFVS